MNNKKLELHQRLLQEALSILNSQEQIEDVYDFDPDYVKHKEEECIMEYSAKLAGIMQVSFNQVSNAFPIGTIVINNEGKAELV